MILDGFKPGELGSLPSSTKKKLLRLMARISDESYERGFKHGALVGPTEARLDWGLDPVERLLAIYPLSEIGLADELC